MNLSAGLSLQPGATSVPGVTEFILIPWEAFTYTAGSNGDIATIAAASATNGYRFELPDNAGDYTIGFAGQGLNEYTITATYAAEGLNKAISQVFKSVEECPKMLVLAAGKGASATDKWRVLGRYNGVRVTAGNESTSTSGTAPVNTLTFTGTEPTKPEWIELTAAEGIDDALTQITIV